MVKDLAGAILAAGTGERLRHDVSGLPKPLVEVGGQALLVRQARLMIEAGAASVMAVVSSETADLIARRALELPSGLKLIVRDTPNSMETLFATGERLSERRFLLATVDAIVPAAEFKGFVTRALELAAPDRSDGVDGVLGIVRWRGDRRPLFAEVDRDGLITALGDREARDVTAGVYLLSAEIFRFAEQARAAGLRAMREFLAFLLRNGMRFAAIELSEAIDVDEAADLEATRAMLGASGTSIASRNRSD